MHGRVPGYTEFTALVEEDSEGVVYAEPVGEGHLKKHVR